MLHISVKPKDIPHILGGCLPLKKSEQRKLVRSVLKRGVAKDILRIAPHLTPGDVARTLSIASGKRLGTHDALMLLATLPGTNAYERVRTIIFNDVLRVKPKRLFDEALTVSDQNTEVWWPACVVKTDTERKMFSKYVETLERSWSPAFYFDDPPYARMLMKHLSAFEQLTPEGQVFVKKWSGLTRSPGP